MQNKRPDAREFVKESIGIAAAASAGIIGLNMAKGAPVAAAVAALFFTIAVVLFVRLLALPIRSAIHRRADRVEATRPRLAAFLRRIR